MVGARPRRHDDDRRHPRDGLRPQGGQPGRLHGRRPDRRVRRPGDLLHQPASRTGPRTSCPRSSTTDRSDGGTAHAHHPLRRLAGGRRPHARRLRWQRGRQPGRGGRGEHRRGRGGRRVRGRHHDGRAERGRRDHGRHEVRPARLRPAQPRRQEPEGFDVEIAKIIAAKLGIAAEDIEWIETVSANREPFIQNGQVDIVVATYTINDARKQLVDFAGPYYEAGQDIMVAEGNPEGIAGPDDLAGKNVCSVEGSTPAQNIRDNYPEATLTLFDVYSKCADALADGQVDAVTTDNVILTGLVAGSDGRLRARRQPVHRGAVRHRPRRGRHRVPQLHQRRARGVLRGRLVGRGLGPHRRCHQRHGGSRAADGRPVLIARGAAGRDSRPGGVRPDRDLERGRVCSSSSTTSRCCWDAFLTTLSLSLLAGVLALVLGTLLAAAAGEPRSRRCAGWRPSTSRSSATRRSPSSSSS